MTILKVWRVVYSLCCKPKELQVVTCVALWHIVPFLFMNMTLTQNTTSELIPFSFNKKPLLSIIDELAKKKGLNLVLPTNLQVLTALNKQTITFQPHGKTRIPVPEAWNLLQTMAELSGFSLMHKKDNLTIDQAIGPNGPTATRDILPLYVDTKTDQLPNSDERIRYLYYPRNLKMPSMQEKEGNPLTKVLKDLLSKDATILFDPRANGLLMVDKATHILSALNILVAFDNAGFEESLVYVHLNNVPAVDVVRVLDSLKKAAGEEQQQYPFIRSDSHTDSFTHFAADTKIIVEERSNGIILVGRTANIERIREFITQSIDLGPEKGQSILHSYDLQYLDAQTFAPQLQKIVSSFTQSGSQATQNIPQGTERFFRGVQVIAEPIVEGPKEFTTEEIVLDQQGALAESKGAEGISSSGGNRLIIAAVQDDWLFIKALLEKLDIPQYQVVLEMFLVDFTYDHTTALEGDSRSRTDNMLPRGLQYLASHITPVNNVLGSTPTQLATDLLQVVGPNRLEGLLPSGSTLFSFNDPVTPGIFGLLLLLEQVVTAKITTSPYLFITNHKKGSIESQEIRRTNGDLVTVSNGSYTIPIVDVPATIKVEAIPHILSEDKVRLEIALTIEQFVGTTFNRLTRSLKTTSTLRDGQILAMGGLINVAKIELETNTPFFARIPLVGWFFKGRSYEDVKTNVTLFVSPTIIEPRKRKGLTRKTRDRICFSNEVDDQEFFDQRDPISRIFFKEHNNQIYNQFLRESSNMPDLRVEDCTAPVELLKTPKTPKASKSFKINELKELLAQQKSPFSRTKRKGQLVFNG